MDYLATVWCKAVHDSTMWPCHGHYQCRTCGREYPVPWEPGITKTGRPQQVEGLVDGGRLGGRPIAHIAQARPS